MTVNKPASDGFILHFFWDGTNGYDAQFFVGNGTNNRIQKRGQSAGVWGDWNNIVMSGTSSVGSSTTPAYISSSGIATACSAMMPLSGSTFTGIAYAQTNTSYTTYQLRNIAFTTSTPSSLTNGNVCMVYS